MEQVAVWPTSASVQPMPRTPRRKAPSPPLATCRSRRRSMAPAGSPKPSTEIPRPPARRSGCRSTTDRRGPAADADSGSALIPVHLTASTAKRAVCPGIQPAVSVGRWFAETGVDRRHRRVSNGTRAGSTRGRGAAPGGSDMSAPGSSSRRRVVLVLPTWPEGQSPGCRPRPAGTLWRHAGTPSSGLRLVVGSDDVTSHPLGSPMCPGSGTFPDAVEDTVMQERFYICSRCGAIMPSFDITPLHERGGGPPAF